MSRQLLQRGALEGSPRMRPSTWFLWHAHRIRPGDRVVDLACGEGRHSLAAAELGAQVLGFDRDPVTLALARGRASAAGMTVQWMELNLEGEWPDLGVFDAVLVFNYLDRANMPRILQLVAPGGLLIMETFLEAQREAGWARPRARTCCVRVSWPAWLPRSKSCTAARPWRRLTPNIGGQWRALSLKRVRGKR
jgi:2-polyprenyl-3-methyl-5-hydroxy-6-metoxy-1,4-benzoquinol methylase